MLDLDRPIAEYSEWAGFCNEFRQQPSIFAADLECEPAKALAFGLGWFVQEHHGRRLVWHSGWWEDAYSALYLRIPAQQLSFIVLANGEGVWWNNPLDRAEVQRSKFAQAFLQAFVPDK